MEKERIEYLDVIKGISIILVVFCHDITLSQETILGNVIMSMAWGAVPCFMMVSGTLMHRRLNVDWKKYYSQIKRIYILIILWKILYFIFYTRFQLQVTLKEIFEYLFLFSNLSNVNTSHFWFMYAYLSTLLFYPVSHYLFIRDKEGEKIIVFIAGLMFMSGIFIPSCNWFILFTCSNMAKITPINIRLCETIIPFCNYSNMIFYFILGGFLYRYQVFIGKHLKKQITLGMIFIGTLGLMLVKYTVVGNFQWQGLYLEDGYSKISTVVLALGLYILVMTSSTSRKILHIFAKYIGESTMGIFYLHIPLLALFNKYLYPALQTYYSVWLNMLKTICAVAICSILTLWLKKYLF